MPPIPPENTVELRATFTDPVTGLVADPTTVRVTLRQAGGVSTTYIYGVGGSGVTRISQGLYEKLLSPPPPGTTWFYRWEGDGSVESAIDGEFQIAGSFI